MNRQKRSDSIAIRLTPDEKEVLGRRARSLGMSISGFCRMKALYAQQAPGEILAREWVAIALQIRKMQSEGSQKQQLQDILEQLKFLIARTIAK